MDKLLKKKAFLSLIYVVTAFLIEIITFLIMKIGFFPSYWGIDFAFILGIAVVLFIIPSSIATIVVSGILLAIQIVLAFVNEALFRMSGMIFSLTMLNLTKEVGGVFTSNFVNWWMVVGLVLIFGLQLAGMIVLNVKMPSGHMHFTKNVVIVLLVCCLIGENSSILLYQSTLSSFHSTTVTNELSKYDDDHLLYTTQFIPAKAYEKFGTFGFYFMNISNTFDSWFGNHDVNYIQSSKALDKYFSQGQMSEDVYGVNDYYGALDGKNIIVVCIESGEWYGINKEYTPTLYEMAKNGVVFSEYHAKDKTNHSEAMSVLGSYPLDPNNDPSTKLVNSKLAFSLPNLLRSKNYTTNYFHPSDKGFYNRDITYGNNGVYGFDTSHFLDNMPLLDGCDENGNVTKTNFYDFDKDAYVTQKYFPEYTYKKEDSDSFYTLNMTLTAHGHYEDLIKNGDYPFTSDKYSDLTEAEREKKKNKFTKDTVVKKFEKFYNIIDGYPSDFAVKGIKFNDSVKDDEETIYLRYKRYQAGMMDLDEEINTLLYELERTNQLDDTMIMFYADHSAYYNMQNYYLKGIPNYDNWNTDLYNIPCFMWYGGSNDCNLNRTSTFYDGYHNLTFEATKDKDGPLKSGTNIDKFTCSFDILPTILQLVGYNYNMNLYHGVSMFSDLESVFVSRESGMMSEDIFYDGTTISYRDESGVWNQYDYESTRYNDEDGFSPEIEKFLTATINYYEKQEMLEEMYKCDYFSYRSIFSDMLYENKVFNYIK